MAERIRSVSVTVVVDTNKTTYEEKLVWAENETHEEFERRVVETIASLTELS